MSAVYSTEPAPSGKVVVKTTVGDLEVELFAKETPKTCRNFIQLALEGYYDGCLFHRVVPGFIVQTGDPTGTGEGGESVYGRPFPDELHSRLRFNRRGLLGMATVKQGENGSQFFFTLDKTEELNRKHTMFGRVVGDTVFNLLRIGEVETDDNERPVNPVKVVAIEVLNNPFDDIVPRTTALERRAEEEARAMAERRKAESEERKRTAKISTKNKNLLSFEDEEEPLVAPLVKSAHDIADDGRLSKKAIAIEADSKGPKGADTDSDDSDESSEDEAAVRRKTVAKVQASRDAESGRTSDAKRQTLQEMKDEKLKTLEAEIASVENSLRSKPAKEAQAPAPKKPRSFVEQQRALYLNSKKSVPGKKDKRKIDEDAVLAQLQSFSKRIRTTQEPATGNGQAAKASSANGDDDDGERCSLHNRANCASCRREDVAVADMEDEDAGDDEGWLGHALHFDKETGVRDVFKPEDYEVLDPREDR
ncbi:cyclophilin-like domain-containing protein [Hyaloraphidium curvatum]|nr:cyclophilin-like domain-containing protein [Hyaloraphidium curvatum]